MKSYVRYSLLIFFQINMAFAEIVHLHDPNHTYIVIDSENQSKLPKNFRIISSSILKNINASASGQFSEAELQKIIKKIPKEKNIIIIDLREETHGFINGIAISWYGVYNHANLNITLDKINEDEIKRIDSLRAQKNIELFNIIDKKDGIINSLEGIKVRVNDTYTEEELTKKYNLRYIRFPVTDHLKPNDYIVDQLMNLVKRITINDWLHIHCRAGKGRTTTFLVMLDIMKNAKKTSLEHIIDRHYKLGGIDLAKSNTAAWKKTYADERLIFIKNFYEYCKNNNDNFTSSWSNWIKRKNLNNSSIK
ncbi:MAG: phosphatase [Alphaproteobacteria bacterium]